MKFKTILLLTIVSVWLVGCYRSDDSPCYGTGNNSRQVVHYNGGSAKMSNLWNQDFLFERIWGGRVDTIEFEKSIDTLFLNFYGDCGSSNCDAEYETIYLELRNPDYKIQFDYFDAGCGDVEVEARADGLFYTNSSFDNYNNSIGTVKYAKDSGIIEWTYGNNYVLRRL